MSRVGAAAKPSVGGGPGTLPQRLRASVIVAGSWLACRLPEQPLIRLADLAGVAWYHLAPRRRAMARANLGRVIAWLGHEGLAGPRGGAPGLLAAQPRALDRLVRSAFQHNARAYLEVARLPVMTDGYLRERLEVETPELVEEAFRKPGPIIFVEPHFGSIELPGAFLAGRLGRPTTAPIETIGDPPLQRFLVRSRGSSGIRLVGLSGARRELQAALARGEAVGLVADRDLGGGGVAVEFFGRTAHLPGGPALLAVESGAPVYAAAIWRTRPGRYRGRLLLLEARHDGSRRDRIQALVQAQAHAFEDLIGAAPEQWWGAFFPIWLDLAAEGSSGPATRQGGSS